MSRRIENMEKENQKNGNIVLCILSCSKARQSSIYVDYDFELDGVFSSVIYVVVGALGDFVM